VRVKSITPAKRQRAASAAYSNTPCSTLIWCALLCLVLSSRTLAADFVVSSASDIATAMQSAMPGDNLLMTSGDWTDQHIQFSGFGTSSDPITLRALTPGGVTLNGNSRLSISGDWLVADGLNFEGGALDSGNVVEFRGSNGEATNSRFTNSAIVDYNPADINTRYFWVSMYGDSNRVDHNYFSNQDHSGVTVTVWRNDSGPDNHRIDSNYFADRPEGNGNGFETIRIGTSDESLSDSFTVVENNLFERTDGEVEIISNKSGANTFRYNTFRESSGTLTLRHGDGNRVEGNFFIGEGANESGGVRVIGEDQIIINNYFEGLDGRAGGAISISGGVPGSAVNEYYQVKNAIIAHNTIVNVSDAAIKLDDGIGSSGRTLLAENVTIANNLILNASPYFEGSEGSGWTWEGNIAFGGSLGISPRIGITTGVDPELSLGADGLYRPSSTSPVIDSGSSITSGLFSDDMDGQARIGIYDVGADEVSSATLVRMPLEAGDVGPSWLGETIPDPPTGGGGCKTLGCAIQAEDYTSILDPDGDGNTWTTVSVTNALGGEVIQAPGGDRVDLATELHDTIATFELEFETPGQYTAYYRARGFNGSSDSLYTPDDFGVDPDNNEGLTSNGQFSWEKDTRSFEITESHLGVPLEFRLGMREQDAEVDAFVLHLSGSVSDSELDELFSIVPGDYNGDGNVDASDYNAWRSALGETGTGLPADGDGSGTVDIADYEIWKTSYTTLAGSASLNASQQSVPEPSSVWLVSGMLLIAYKRSRLPFNAALVDKFI